MGKEKKSKRRSRSSSSSSDDEKKLKKLKKKLKKEKRRSEKILKKKIKEEKRKLKNTISKTECINKKSSVKSSSHTTSTSSDNTVSADIPVDLMERSKAMAPMTKEEWDRRQSIVRKVYDEDSGRYRLIKGDGEVIESIVSRDQHKQINQQATRADGVYFQANTANK